MVLGFNPGGFAFEFKSITEQIIQMCDTIASTVTLLHGGNFVGGDRYPLKAWNQLA